MSFQNDPTTCYPNGLEPSRRSFMRVLGGVAAGLTSGVSLAELALAQEQQPDVIVEESVPAFPPGGFGKGAVRLNFNENPLGPSKKALQAVVKSGLREGNRYNFIDPLIESIADHHQVSADSVLVGCGSTEFLQFTPWAYLKPSSTIVLPDPSYGYMAGVARSIGAIPIRVPLRSEGRIDIEGLKNATRPDTRILYIANPNNPTGASVPLSEVRSLVNVLSEGSILFVDEAYHDFLPDESAIELVRQGLPVIVARTFSKAYGMAGLRLGYVVAPEAQIERLKEVWWGDLGINTAATIAGPVALQDQDHVRRYVKLVDEGLDQLRSGLSGMGFKPYPHRAPFFMVDLGRRAHPIRLALYKKNIYIQDGKNWNMPNFLRISVGLAEENEKLLSAMQEVI